jgi:class 3 adenylate cyclase
VANDQASRHARHASTKRRRRIGRKKVQGNVAVAMIDILGFSDLSRRESPQSIFAEVFEPLVQVRRNAAAVAGAISGRHEEVFTLAFSDTILVYRPERSDFGIPDALPPHLCIKLVGATVAEIIQKGLRRERPILFRGAIAWGECVINPIEPRCFIGAPIVEAHLLELEQEWAGAVLAPTAAAAFGDPDDLTFVRYDVPLKNGRSLAGAMAVNWLHSMGAHDAGLDRLPAPAADLSEANRAAVLRKHENTRAFYGRFRTASVSPSSAATGRSPQRRGP